jgi:hypothetical protein
LFILYHSMLLQYLFFASISLLCLFCTIQHYYNTFWWPLLHYFVYSVPFNITTIPFFGLCFTILFILCHFFSLFYFFFLFLLYFLIFSIFRCSFCSVRIINLFRLITGFVTRLTRRVHLVEQKLLTLPEHLSSLPVFSGVHVTRSLALCVCFVDSCLSFCSFSLGHCVGCPLSIYGFWLSLWYPETSNFPYIGTKSLVCACLDSSWVGAAVGSGQKTLKLFIVTSSLNKQH